MALKANIAKHYYTLPERARVGLSSTTLLNISRTYSFIFGGGEPILRYNRDNPDSVTISPKVSNKTVFSYARNLDFHDANYYLQPLKWFRHTLNMFRYSISVYGSTEPVFNVLQRRSTKFWCHCIRPFAILIAGFKNQDTVVNYPELDPNSYPAWLKEFEDQNDLTK